MSVTTGQLISSWQVQHGQSVYRVTVKERGMDKAERPLELAEWLEEIAECLSGEESEWTPDEETREEKKRYFETAAILRDYHSLRKKYDALLNAKPIAVLRNDQSNCRFTINPDLLLEGEIVTQLIRKPAE